MVLICISLMISDVEHLMSVGHHYVFFGEMSFHVLVPFLDQIVFVTELYEFLVCFGYQPFMGYIICKYIISFVGYLFVF